MPRSSGRDACLSVRHQHGLARHQGKRLRPRCTDQFAVVYGLCRTVEPDRAFGLGREKEGPPVSWIATHRSGMRSRLERSAGALRGGNAGLGAESSRRRLRRDRRRRPGMGGAAQCIGGPSGRNVVRSGAAGANAVAIIVITCSALVALSAASFTHDGWTGFHVLVTANLMSAWGMALWGSWGSRFSTEPAIVHENGSAEMNVPALLSAEQNNVVFYSRPEKFVQGMLQATTNRWACAFALIVVCLAVRGMAGDWRFGGPGRSYPS